MIFINIITSFISFFSLNKANLSKFKYRYCDYVGVLHHIDPNFYCVFNNAPYSCCICKNAFDLNDNNIIFVGHHCKTTAHIFHIDCVKGWVRECNEKRCPLCNSQIEIDMS